MDPATTGLLIKGGADVLGTFLGNKQQQGLIKEGRKALEQGRDEGGMRAAGMADPFQSYRSQYAQQLDDTLQGRRPFQTDPGYQFVYDEAMRGVNRQHAAGGHTYSGRRQYALQDRAAGLASQEYGNIIQRLTNLAGATPSNAANAGSLYGQANTTAMSGIADLYNVAGEAQAQTTGGIGGIIGSVAGSIFK